MVSRWFQAGFKGFMHLPRISMHQVLETARLPRILPALAQVAEILEIVEAACQVADLAEVVRMVDIAIGCGL